MWPVMSSGASQGRARRLMFGHLFAYALARRLGLPLLYQRNDFARADVMRRYLEHAPLIDLGRKLR